MDTDVLKIFLWIAFGGWSLYLTTERSRLVNDIKKLQQRNEEVEKNQIGLQHDVDTRYWTKQDHLVFENRLSDSIDKLSVRFDAFVVTWSSEMGKLHEKINHRE